jgi:hypothetical protein
MMGLLTEQPNNGDPLDQAVLWTSPPRVQEFLTNSPWDERGRSLPLSGEGLWSVGSRYLAGRISW